MRRTSPDPPVELARLVAVGRSGGAPPSPGVTWARRRWIAAFPELAQHLRSLPDRVDRESVRRACTEAGRHPTSALRGFVTVMAWSFGSAGYGPSTTRRIVDARRSYERLQHAARVLERDGAMAAYRELCSTSRIPRLSASLGTTYLSFCPQAPAPAARALILDRHVSDWIAERAGVTFDPVPWHAMTYQQYLDLMGRWAAVLGVTTDRIEQCIGASGTRRLGSQRAR